MEIRKANQEDIPEIIHVLKKSLGEKKIAKTEDIWFFKHLDNPFGKSLVLIAIEDNKIIGVRAYMKWEWKIQDDLIRAYRAVDTATHPNHRRKGVFKKLTLQANEIAQQEGRHIIFNTPNSQSKPGYLKMGWEEVGKLSIRFIPVNPFKIKKNTEKPELKIESLANNNEIFELIQRFNKTCEAKAKIFTPKSLEYLSWRYKMNPLQNYQILEDENFFVAAYLKKHRYFNELRVTELIYEKSEVLKEIKKNIFKWAFNLGAHIISISDTDKNDFFNFSINGTYGPILTVRQLNEFPVETNFNEIVNWNYTLGDLELF